MTVKTKRMTCITLVLVIFLSFYFLLPSPSFASSKQKRPKIGLVLGGGGAKGSAHIGVLKVLEELRIPVDCIAGTSMGAIVGSLYASGMSADEIEEVLTTVDWEDLFTDSPPRKEIDFRRKQEDITFLSKITVGIKDGKVRLPKGIIAGQKISLFFETLMIPVADIKNFDHLPIPFRGVATDLETGEMVVMGSGSLADAARASMSVPGAFPPFEVNGQYLIDGGIVRNLPVDIVREMGAEIIIAVDVGKPLLTKDDLTGPFPIMNQMMDIMIKQNVKAQIATLSKKDVFINPDLGTIESGDFKRGKEAVERGITAARYKENELRRYSVTEKEYAVFEAKHQRKEVSEIKVGEVKVKGLSLVNPDTVASKLKIKEGDMLDPETLRKDVGLIYGLGDFELVDLNVRPRGDEYDIFLNATEKSWGPNYLRVGINLESDFDGNNDFNILADYTMRWINRLGAEWKNQLQIGSTKRVFSEFYQPLVASRLLFLSPHVEWRQENVNLYDENDVFAEYRLRTIEGGLDLGIQPWSYGEIRMGYFGGSTRAKVQKGNPDLPEGTIDIGALRARVVADQVDNANFPHEGYFGYIDVYSSLKDVGADDNYNKIEVSFIKAFTYKKYTILGSIRYGSYIGNEIPFYDEFTLGGFLSLSGLHRNQIRGQQMGLGKIVTYWNASQSLLGNFYLGGSLETGNVWAKDEDIDFDTLRLAGSVFIGYDMFLGPLYVAIGHADEGNTAFYVYLGRTF